MKQKLMTFALGLCMLGMLSSCSSDSGTTTGATTGTDSSTDNSTSTDSTVGTESTGDYGDFKIGVVQLAEHPALDASTQGFVDDLVAYGFDIDNIDIQNASGVQATCSTIAQKFVNDKVDLIFAVATPAAQATLTATSEIPILATAVTDFPVAGLEGPNITGMSDMGPVARQAELVMEIAPDAQEVGILYCSSEDNSFIQAEMAKEVFEAMGVSTSEYTAADTNEVQLVVQNMLTKVDAVYVPTDNLFAQTMASVAMLANTAGVPVIAGESGMVDSGALCTIGVDYYGLGQATAAMAIEVLVEGVDISTIPVGFSDEDSWSVTVNAETQAALGITELPAILQE